MSRRVINASVVLGQIYKDNDAFKNLAEYYSVPESTIARVVEGLIQQGYLTRLPPGGGGVQFRLTPRGSSLVQAQVDQNNEAARTARMNFVQDNNIVQMTGDDKKDE